MSSYCKPSSGQESQPLGFGTGVKAVLRFNNWMSYWFFPMSDHSHHGHHNHSHGVSSYGRAFLISITLNTLFVAIEATYGFVGHSLALIADAGHNLGDVLGLIVAWVATILVKRQPSTRWTFGLRRSSILAAFGNAAVLLIVSGGICLEAIQCIQKPEPIAGHIVMTVAVIGIATETSLMAHLVMPEGTGGDRFLAEVAETLEHQFKIHHMNLQIETGDPAFPCAQAPAEVL
jgi:Co/Zn/Cd efflux system component